MEAPTTLRTYQYSQLSPAEFKQVLARPRVDFTSILNTVSPIVDNVRANGDDAVREYTAKFDRVTLDTVCVPIEVLYCARKAGVTHILKAGGAQAVAAMAWGTASCPKVDKILGPGNQYVTAAKMLLQVGIEQGSEGGWGGRGRGCDRGAGGASRRPRHA
ncbi:Histidinol dehydrogenase, chloroplastic [Tetrabaena socialis]|uniref:Histidinol dehydrogenase, chloroplastic n=1 Tax=Tetrabaena socialis TaxID=47790 RepID=A0A2J8A678_9CHLO|nr:Histidinol dehydrogenase, chloroplastic [Tetrabaena socialis]|eukprot:PNH07997.1 Histidinol dehydrogenase, chloroplastic [Tetrabaena socialis]